MNPHVGLSALERDLPPVTLLCGPRAGESTLAEHLITHHQVHPADVLRCPAPLTVAAARAVSTFLNTAALGRFKLVYSNLDGAGDAALNALLKPLEEPPAGARFLLTSTRLPLPTIVSRATVYQLGQDPADPAGDSTDAARATALTIIRAIATADGDLFDRAVRGVDHHARQLLLQLLIEAYTGQWSAFTSADLFGLPHTRLQAMITALHQLPHARPRLNVRVGLQPFVSPT